MRKRLNILCAALLATALTPLHAETIPNVSSSEDAMNTTHESSQHENVVSVQNQHSIHSGGSDSSFDSRLTNIEESWYPYNHMFSHSSDDIEDEVMNDYLDLFVNDVFHSGIDETDSDDSMTDVDESAIDSDGDVIMADVDGSAMDSDGDVIMANVDGSAMDSDGDVIMANVDESAIDSDGDVIMADVDGSAIDSDGDVIMADVDGSAMDSDSDAEQH